MARIRYAATAIEAAKDLAKAQKEIAKGANSSANAFRKADKEVRLLTTSKPAGWKRIPARGHVF